MDIHLRDIEKAQESISKHIRKTPFRISTSSSERVGVNLWLKMENLQKTGSFKIRGATNKILNLTEEQKRNGIIASSAGNHAQGVASAAQGLGIPVKVVMPKGAPIIKVQNTKAYGAEVILHGDYYDEAYKYAISLGEQHSYEFIHPYQDPHIIAGQGTIGLEILEGCPDLDMVIVPIGGGGLISGIAKVIKSKRPNCKVIGVQAAGASSMARSFGQKTVAKNVDFYGSIADGIAVKSASQVMLDHFISKYVDEIVTVSDDEIAEAMVFLLERSKSVVEGAGAAAAAAAYSGRLALGKNTAVILCGGNVDLNMISKVIELGLSRRGRVFKLFCTVDDLPGSLSKLTTCIAKESANILQVYHDRISTGRYINEAKIEFILETRGMEHIEKITKALEQVGAKVSH